jgi:hypothetical protein
LQSDYSDDCAVIGEELKKKERRTQTLMSERKEAMPIIRAKSDELGGA